MAPATGDARVRNASRSLGSSRWLSDSSEGEEGEHTLYQGETWFEAFDFIQYAMACCSALLPFWSASEGCTCCRAAQSWSLKMPQSGLEPMVRRARETCPGHTHQHRIWET